MFKISIFELHRDVDRKIYEIWMLLINLTYENVDKNLTPFIWFGVFQKERKKERKRKGY